MTEIEDIGKGWLLNEANGIVTKVDEYTPVEFCEKYRYLPEHLSPIPGPMSFDINPFMREILDNADVDSTVSEVNLKKGVQITFTTLLECIIFYYVVHVKGTPIMFVSADDDLAKERMKANVVPMFNESGYSDLIQSSDPHSRRTGKTEKRIEFQGGSFIIPQGANSANKNRSWSIKVMLKDEISGWKYSVGKDGNPDKTTDDRCAAFEKSGYKIFRGSTPNEFPDHIEDNYLRGDQRKYFVPCQNKACGEMQFLEWSGENKATEDNPLRDGQPLKYGITYERDKDGVLDPESVCYVCKYCGHKHYEHDKEAMFDPANGAEWRPTAKPIMRNIRSYHLPGLYSPIGMKSWASCVKQRMDCYDESGNVKDYESLKVWFNNVLAEPWEQRGGKIPQSVVWEHRRMCYKFGQVPNNFAKKHSGSRIMFLTCLVDVQKHFLSVGVFGWTQRANCYLIDYFDIKAQGETDTCDDIGSSCWATLDDFLQSKEYESDDGIKYRINVSGVDAGWGDSTSTVQQFCATLDNVYPLMGVPRPDIVKKIVGWTESKTDYGDKQFMIVVDHYKDRLGRVLRREWIPEENPTQDEWHFNAPYDIQKKHIKELIAEYKRQKKEIKGKTIYEWHRPNNVRNELWDLLVYGHAFYEIRAWYDCTVELQLPEIDWQAFYEYRESLLPPEKKSE